VLGSVEFFVAFADEGGGFAALQRTKTSTVSARFGRELFIWGVKGFILGLVGRGFYVTE
jgi:hypothetical protein